MRVLFPLALFLSASLALAVPIDDVPPPLIPIGIESEGVQPLLFDAAAYADLADRQSIRLEAFPLPGAAPVTLDLERFDVLEADATLRTADERRELAAPRPDVQLWRGTVAGVDGSHVYLGLSPSGIAGYITAGDARYILSTGPAGTRPPVIYSLAGAAAQRLNIQMPACAGALPNPDALGGDPDDAPGGYGDRALSCRTFRLAIECDTAFTDLFGGNTAASGAYATLLLGAVSEIYNREASIRLTVNYLRTWTGADPYTATSAGNRLGEFRTYWNSNMGSVQRQLAHMLSGEGLGGGVAWLNAACGSYGYAVSGNLGGAFPYPITDHSHQNWDLMVVTHEIGHNLGSGHTHDPNSYAPPIDACGAAYLTPPGVQNCSNAYAIGSIMSYCHICPGGMSNMSMVFGPRVVERLRAYTTLSVPNCGTTVAPPAITDHPDDTTAAQGTNLQMIVNASGTSNVYQWRRDGVLLTNNANYANTAGRFLIITNAVPALSGSYVATAVNSCGTATSTAATLVVSSPCGTTDFDGDGDAATDADIEALFAVIGGTGCPTPSCGSTDFDGDGDAGTDADIEAFFRVIAGGPC